MRNYCDRFRTLQLWRDIDYGLVFLGSNLWKHLAQELWGFFVEIEHCRECAVAIDVCEDEREGFWHRGCFRVQFNAWWEAEGSYCWHSEACSRLRRVNIQYLWLENGIENRALLEHHNALLILAKVVLNNTVEFRNLKLLILVLHGNIDVTYGHIWVLIFTNDRKHEHTPPIQMIILSLCIIHFFRLSIKVVFQVIRPRIDRGRCLFRCSAAITRTFLLAICWLITSVARHWHKVVLCWNLLHIWLWQFLRLTNLWSWLVVMLKKFTSVIGASLSPYFKRR